MDNPYVLAGLAMCGIVLVALVGTAYLAVMFNRRAKADLRVAFTPLAELLDGDIDLDEATVSGRFNGYLTAARMANAPSGPARVFQVEMIDAAGGEGWTFRTFAPRKEESERAIEFESEVPHLRSQLPSLDTAKRVEVSDGYAWMTIDYDPEAGHVQLMRPLLNRGDIPSRERFERYLSLLAAICEENRAVQTGIQVERGEEAST